jgi:hypothetical protein
MSSDDGTTTFTESPASWNTRYLDPSGFECQLTLRADNGSELLEKANNAILFLLTNACTPAIYFRNGMYKSESKAKEIEKTELSSENNSHIDQTPSPSWCPIHFCEMKRWEKNDRVWFSHKTPEGWCSGKPKNN